MARIVARIVCRATLETNVALQIIFVLDDEEMTIRGAHQMSLRSSAHFADVLHCMRLDTHGTAYVLSFWEVSGKETRRYGKAALYGVKTNGFTERRTPAGIRHPKNWIVRNLWIGMTAQVG
jgi:hypothetical protein